MDIKLSEGTKRKTEVLMKLRERNDEKVRVKMEIEQK
jgi:hypothetical protein